MAQLLKSVYSELRAINLYMEGTTFSVSTICWLCIKPGIQERGTECGERREWGNVAKYSGGMSLNISENVAKHSGECRQIFQGMPSKSGVLWGV